MHLRGTIPGVSLVYTAKVGVFPPRKPSGYRSPPIQRLPSTCAVRPAHIREPAHVREGPFQMSPPPPFPTS